jgi:hypothetical protein
MSEKPTNRGIYKIDPEMRNPNYFHDDLKKCQKQVIEAAEDLRYGDEVLERLRNATTEAEMERIMIAARHARFGE